MDKLYNIGDSFSYGNCVQSYETFANDYKHLGPGDIIAKELGYEHINLASPGLSPDGVLRRLYTTDFEEVNSFLLIGIPPENRFQTIGERPRDQHKDRSTYNGTEYKAKAFQHEKGYRVARLPNIVVHQLAKKGILNYNGKVLDKSRFFRWLNDSDNRHFRIYTGNL